MAKTLKEHFPLIRDREEVLADIYGKESLLEVYESWTEEQQNRFVEYCTGMRGVKILYDQFFKRVINPEEYPERLEEILTVILEQKVRILQVLPNESTRISAEKSLLVLDIVVELKDGSIANVEVQRIGYLFPGQRAACYSADLLMRQYKRMKKRKKKNFKYSDIKKVYTIAILEKSPGVFHQLPNKYIHHSKQITDTGLEIDLVQEYIFVALDIFREQLHNKGIEKNNKLEAWLTFLSEDDPEWIVKLISAYPRFKKLYAEVYETCRNTEVMMGLFSEELIEMDKNTVEFMIDQMQDVIDEQKEKIVENEKQIAENEKQLAESEKQLAESEKQLAESEKQLAESEKQLVESEKQLVESEKQLAENEKQLAENEKRIREQKRMIEERDELIAKLRAQLAERE